MTSPSPAGRPPSLLDLAVRAGVPAVAEEQGGVFTRRQAIAEGWSHGQVARRLTGGRWYRVCGPALTADPPPFCLRHRAWAAQLSVLGSVLSHASAAALFGWPVDDAAAVHVIGPRTGHRVPMGVRRHLLALSAREVTLIQDGLLVTNPARTAVDCLMSLPRGEAENLWAWLVTRRSISRDDLGRAARAAFGRPGAKQLLALYAMSATGAVNPGELRLHTLLRDAGLTGWEANVQVEVGDVIIAVVDLLFRRARLVVELDGYRAHSGPEAFVRDRQRQNALVHAGYTVLRVTWHDLDRRPEVVVEQIRGILGR